MTGGPGMVVGLSVGLSCAVRKVCKCSVGVTKFVVVLGLGHMSLVKSRCSTDIVTDFLISTIRV